MLIADLIKFLSLLVILFIWDRFFWIFVFMISSFTLTSEKDWNFVGFKVICASFTLKVEKHWNFVGYKVSCFG